MKRFFRFVCIISGLLTTPAYSQEGSSQSGKQWSADILIDSLSAALLRNYVFPAKAAVMAKQLQHRRSRLKYRNINSPDELASKLETDLQQWHRDPHLHLSYDPEFESHLLKPRPSQHGIDSNALTHARLGNFGFQKVEILNGNIGYVEFTEFHGNVEAARETVAAAFSFLRHSSELIVDLRRNGGGSPEMVRHIASYFVQNKTRLNDIYNRRRNDTTQYWADPADAGNMGLAMPVYILTDKRTFSAAEDFAYAFKINRRAILVGDTTRGGAHPTISLPMGQGFVLNVPFARSINFITKTDWEGTGVLPDFPCSGPAAMDLALQQILESRMARSADEAERHRTQWLMDAMKAKDSVCDPDLSLWGTYCGQYGRFSIDLRDRQLFLNDFTGRSFLLRSIAPDHFLADDGSRLDSSRKTE